MDGDDDDNDNLLSATSQYGLSTLQYFIQGYN